MHIIVCGAGQVGSSIAKQLAREGNEVTIIDQSVELIRDLNDKLDVKAIAGYASHPHVLAKAGLAEADMLIAVTYSDEVNMIACQVGHTLFNVPTKIARVRHRDYLMAEWKTLYSRNHMPIDVIISPEMEVAEAILRRLHVPGAVDMIPFVDDKLRVIAVRCESNCAMNHLPLSVVRARLKDVNQSIIGIIHDNHFSLPKDNTILQEGDTVYLVCKTSDMHRALASFGHEEREAHRLIILGGGNVGAYIAKALEKEEYDTRVKLIEFSKSRAETIAQEFSDTTVVNGSGLDSEILMECGVESAETIVCVTNDDKVNILSSLLAKRHGCQRSIALVNNNAYIPLLGNLGVDVTVNPRENTVSSILQHVRRGKIRNVHSVHDGAAEIIQAQAVATSPLVGKTIESLNLPAGIHIGALVRGEEVIMVDANTVIAENDQVLMISKADSVKKVEKFFSVSLEFF